MPRADATGCLDPTRRDDTIVGIRCIVPPEARLMVRWIELPMRRWGVMKQIHVVRLPSTRPERRFSRPAIPQARRHGHRSHDLAGTN